MHDSNVLILLAAIVITPDLPKWMRYTIGCSAIIASYVLRYLPGTYTQ